MSFDCAAKSEGRYSLRSVALRAREMADCWQAKSNLDLKVDPACAARHALDLGWCHPLSGLCQVLVKLSGFQHKLIAAALNQAADQYGGHELVQFAHLRTLPLCLSCVWYARTARQSPCCCQRLHPRTSLSQVQHQPHQLHGLHCWPVQSGSLPTGKWRYEHDRPQRCCCRRHCWLGAFGLGSHPAGGWSCSTQKKLQHLGNMRGMHNKHSRPNYRYSASAQLLPTLLLSQLPTFRG
jgi:hypothetical protein